MCINSKTLYTLLYITREKYSYSNGTDSKFKSFEHNIKNKNLGEENKGKNEKNKGKDKKDT
jgi:hypothetical protein